VTVVANFTITPRFWRGYDDPSLPVGQYLAQGSVIGDATGGRSSCIFIFHFEGDPVSGRLFNIEQMNCSRVGGITTRAGHIISENFGRVGPTGLLRQEYVFQMIPNAGITGAAVSYERLPRFPIFLGQGAAVPGIASQVIVGSTNVDTETVVATIQGYIWESRSLMAAGGVQRPIQSVFG